MMMPPRTFVANPNSRGKNREYNEKDEFRKRVQQHETRRKSSSALSMAVSPPRITSPSESNARSSPVQIPPRSSKTPSQPQRSLPIIPETKPPAVNISSSPRNRVTSPHEVLSATAIPIRKKPKGRTAQRIPKCDYVADFSKLLLDDVKSNGETSTPSSFTNPHFDGLFGNIDELVEGQMIVGSEGLDAGILSARSMSSESVPSLASPDDFHQDELPSTSPIMRSLSERRLRQVAASEDAGLEHPLMDYDLEDDDDGTTTPDLMMAASPTRKTSPKLQEKKANSFKSSLTASLKAIKYAAQSVSSYVPASTMPEESNFTKSFFDFQPYLTDDRRPPPTDEPPSPALRRYLNPHTSSAPDSPAQLHFWMDEKQSPSTSPSSSPKASESSKPRMKVKKKYLNKKSATSSPTSPIHQNPDPNSSLPRVVPLATCIPPTIRTAHASSPPIWLAPDGTPSNKRTAPTVNLYNEETGLRQREPRENRDFLRVFVAEMAMRKNGKLDEKAPGRAVLWLPPVKERDETRARSRTGSFYENGAPTTDQKGRWRSWSADDLMML